MKRGVLPKAPNYTNAALVMALVNLLWIFAVLWAVFGMPVVLAIGYVLNLAISRFSRRAGA
ncbi:hypothetical protein [Roseovarius amoyensis]|uniref:hypothetical protein n=1 Tax=Roseovarius amoyensis TaxID=2211448 RepID=UPI000DBE4910|nr:hypothetical protein [Roseovarius amoyensis]